MAEAEQAERIVLVLRFCDPFLQVAAIVADGLEHFDHLLVGTAVQRTPERGDTGADRAVQVRLAAAHHAHGARAAVLFMIGVQDQQRVQGAGHHGIHLVILGGQAEHHVQEILHVTELVVRVHVRVAKIVLVADRRQGGHFRDQAEHRAFHLLLRPVRILALRVEGAQRIDHRRQDPHRVRIAGEELEEALHVLVHQRVRTYVLLEFRQLFTVRQIAEKQQVGDFQERGFLGQLFDRVATVMQNALLSIEESDRALGGPSVLVTEVQRNEARLVAQLAYVDRLFALAAFNNRVFIRFAIKDDLRRFAHLPLRDKGRCAFEWRLS